MKNQNTAAGASAAATACTRPSARQHTAPRLLAVALACCAGPAGADSSLQFSSGADYSAGKFGGSDRTEVLVVPLSARLRWNSWSLRATLPYVTVRGPADVTVFFDDNGGGGGGSSGGSSSESGSGRGSGSSGSGSGSGGGGSDDGSGAGSGSGSGSGSSGSGSLVFPSNRSVSGLGDASLALTRSFESIAGTPLYLDVTGRVKFPTGESRNGLGVGATDYGLASELGWAGDVGGVYVTGGRRFLGSTATLKRVDGWQWSAGGYVNVTRAVELGAVYSWRAASVAGGVDAKSLEGSLSLLLGSAWQLGAYGGVGLSTGSPDYTAGLSLSWRLPL